MPFLKPRQVHACHCERGLGLHRLLVAAANGLQHPEQAGQATDHEPTSLGQVHRHLLHPIALVGPRYRPGHCGHEVLNASQLQGMTIRLILYFEENHELKQTLMEARLRYCNALGTLIVKAMSLSYIDTVSGVVFAARTHRFLSFCNILLAPRPDSPPKPSNWK